MLAGDIRNGYRHGEGENRIGDDDSIYLDLYAEIHYCHHKIIRASLTEQPKW